MNNLELIQNHLRETIAVKQSILKSDEVLESISLLADKIVDAYRKGNKVMLAGNGGSAADSQHIASELVSRFMTERSSLPALALTTDPSVVTAISNDYGYQDLFARQLQAHSKPGDIFLGISTSGNSENILRAAGAARECGVFSAGLCGESGQLPDMVDLAIRVPSSSTQYIQESHIAIGHVICAIVEASLFGQ